LTLFNRTLLTALLAVPVTVSAQSADLATDPCATNPASCATLINTAAVARTRIPNTAADISVAISISDKDIPSVQRALAQKSAMLLAWLRTQGVQRLVSNRISFTPETRSSKSAPDKTLGYNGSLQVSFRTTPEKAPEILAGVLMNGANTIESTNFTPTEEELSAARRELSTQATRNAIAEAEATAKAAGMHMVSARKIDVLDNGSEAMAYTPGAGLTMYEQKARIETASGDRSLSMMVAVTSTHTVGSSVPDSKAVCTKKKRLSLFRRKAKR